MSFMPVVTICQYQTPDNNLLETQGKCEVQFGFYNDNLESCIYPLAVRHQFESEQLDQSTN